MGAKAADKEFDALCARLGAPAPESLRSLSPAALRDLNGAVDAARRRQGQALATAGERALGQVPRLLRGPIRRVAG